MKLLTRTTLYYLVLSTLLVVAGGLLFYPLLRNIIYNQIDSNLREEQMIIAETIDYADHVPDFRPVFGHQIEVTIFNSPRKKLEILRDTSIYIASQGEFARYRHLQVESTSIKNKGYIINLYQPLKESELLIRNIYLAVFAMFIILLLLLVAVNYLVARGAWVAFHRTLARLGAYDINQEEPLVLTPTSIREFINLNKALEKMSKRIRKDFLLHKEFNENVAHELQTPLAVIKSKIDLLVQDESLTESQLKLLNSMAETVSRMAKLNQGLLLISRIDNNQFTDEREVDLATLFRHSADQLSEIIAMRSITFDIRVTGQSVLTMNPVLAEIMLTNLLTNAIRHNIEGGQVMAEIGEGRFTLSNCGPEPPVSTDLLFQRFRKPDPRTGSVGLGLSIVQKIAARYSIKVAYLYADGWHTLKLEWETDPLQN